MGRRLVLIVAATAGVAAWLALGRSAPAVHRAAGPPIGELFTDLTARYGVEVRWRIDPEFFPAEWADATPSAEPIDEPELRRMPAILTAALAAYPKELIRRDLRRICVAGALSFFGQPYGGTYDDDSVYLCSEGELQGFDDVYLMGTFHHELSSILMRNYGFETERWRSCNPKSFAYSASEGGGVQAIVNAQDSLDGAPEYYEQGLLSQYGKSELEEDFNTYCEAMMTEPARLRRLAARYPVIAAKAALCREFYRRLGIEVPQEP